MCSFLRIFQQLIKTHSDSKSWYFLAHDLNLRQLLYLFALSKALYLSDQCNTGHGLHLVRGEYEGKAGPSVLNLFEGIFYTQLFLSTVHNLAAGIYILMQSQPHQTTQAESFVHYKVHPCRLMQHSRMSESLTWDARGLTNSHWRHVLTAEPTSGYPHVQGRCKVTRFKLFKVYFLHCCTLVKQEPAHLHELFPVTRPHGRVV